MPKYCPHCNHEIDSLNYCCSYTEWGSESGTCDLEGGDQNCDDRNGNDSETDEYEYSCPHCEEELCTDELLDEPRPETEITAERRENRIPYTPLNRNQNNDQDNITRKFPSIECPFCHKVNYRGEDDKVILCDSCNEEIIIN